MKSGGSRVVKALPHSLDIHLRRNHLGGPPMPQETPGDMRQAKPVRDRLDMPGEEMLMPDRTGLHDLGLLDAVGEHPVVILCMHPFLQRQQPLDVCLR